MGGPSAKVGSSAKIGVAIFMASILDSLGGSICQSMFVCQVLCTGIQGIYALLMGGPLAKVGSSAKFGAVVFKASILNSLVVPLAKLGLAGKFGAAVFKASILDSLGGSICQSMFVCQVLCTGIQGIYALLMGDPLAKVGSSAKFGAVVFKASMLDSLGGPSAKVCSSAKFGIAIFKASMLY